MAKRYFCCNKTNVEDLSWPCITGALAHFDPDVPGLEKGQFTAKRAGKRAFFAGPVVHTK